MGSKGRYEVDGPKAQPEPGDGPGVGLGAEGPGGAAILELLLSPQRPPGNGAIGLAEGREGRRKGIGWSEGKGVGLGRGEW